jgi:soluble lytic murein transglycosylase-like protein
MIKLLFGVLFFFTATVSAEELQESVEKIRLNAINYEHGRDGVKQDTQKAFSLYCQAALKGDAESAYNLGFMYFNGRGISRDHALAARWFKQAANSGDSQARNILVRLEGIGAKEDINCKPAEPNFKPVYETSPNKRKVASLVNQIAPAYGIDPQLVMAVIQAESDFNPNALSEKNAQGLMQLIPETAERFGVKDSLNPFQNINGGTAYLHWLLRHFKGKVELVLAAYNAGEGAVERYQGVPPFEETKNYVKTILSWYPKIFHPIPPETVDKAILTGKI